MPAIDRLRKAVEEKRLTFSRIARESGLAVSTVHDILNGRITDPKASTMDGLDHAAWSLLGPDPRVGRKT
jgi:transcriptional regulator with XRE-family HTH domain